MLISTSDVKVQYAGTFLAALGTYPTIPNISSWAANGTEGVYKGKFSENVDHDDYRSLRCARSLVFLYACLYYYFFHSAATLTSIIVRLYIRIIAKATSLAMLR